MARDDYGPPLASGTAGIEEHTPLSIAARLDRLPVSGCTERSSY
jgi:hypothetical protein